MTDVQVPAALSGYRPNDFGVLTHALIATVLPELERLPDYQLSQALMVAAGPLVSGRNVNRRRVLVSTAVSHAASYLRRAALTHPYVLLGCEWQTSDGRVDVAWQSPTGGIFFDEVKTTGQALRTVPPAWRDQATRYAQAGCATHGAAFLGVRVIPCGSLHLACLVSADGRVTPLCDAPGLPGVTS